MNKFHPRRYITNFVDGSAEFYDADVPPAEEYLSLSEHEFLVQGLVEALEKITHDEWEVISESTGMRQSGPSATAQIAATALAAYRKVFG